MTLYYQDRWFTLHCGDCRVVLAEMESQSVDSVVCDPPYELGFMGKGWDRSGIAYDVSVWSECLRVLKPGGHLLAFGGSRTYHRLACAIEDAGFEIRDQIQWIYSSGFPKSLNVSKNLREKESVCICNENGKTASQHGLRSLSGSDISPPLYAQDKSGEVLQPSVSQQSASEHRATRAEPETTRRKQSGMERRGDGIQEERQLHRSALCASASVGITDGPQGWLCDGAPTDHGPDVRLSSHQNGSGQSQEPQTINQRREQSGVVSDECGSQARGGWPLCRGCGKPMVPEGIGSALKPAHEPLVLARKPFNSTLTQNVLQHGTGGLNIDGCRIECEPWLRRLAENPAPKFGDCYAQDKWTREQMSLSRNENGHNLGRWPANVIHDGSDEVLAGFPDAPGQQGDLSGHSKDRLSKGIFGDMKAARDATARLDSGSAARFFKSCSHSEIESLFWRAKAIITVWNPSLVSTAEPLLCLSNQAVVSALSGAVISASLGDNQLSGVTGLSMTVTRSELRTLSETLITAILFIAKNVSPAQPPDEPFPNGCLVRIAGTQRPTGIITITISHWRSNGFADPVTLSITQTNLEAGAKDSRSPSRFIYCAKSSQVDRTEGLEDLPMQSAGAVTDRKDGSAGLNSPRAGAGRNSGSRNPHPTVKPTNLMRYLCRLVTPPGGIVLDPFCGSGSTGKAALLEEFQFIGIELSAEYCQLAQRRIQAATQGQASLFSALSEPKPARVEVDAEPAIERSTLFSGVGVG